MSEAENICDALRVSVRGSFKSDEKDCILIMAVLLIIPDILEIPLFWKGFFRY